MFRSIKQRRLNKELSAAARDGNVRNIARLLDEGADIEWRNSNYWDASPLGVALHKGHFPAVKLLVERGADIEAVFRSGDTALMYAIYGGNGDCVRTLVEHGVKLTPVNDEGKSALDLLKGRNEGVRAALGVPEDEKPKQPVAPEIPSDPDEIVLRRKIGDKILEEVFNFNARERVSLIRGAASGPVETMTRENFDEIGERALRRAFEIYARQGGAIPEAEVFPQAMAKIKPRGPG